ncbi:MAG TPA: hypothetical protein VK579_05085 [Terriglobales bacterium]|nr:hypothetical protein [Terriglobales bacterium]
MGHLKDDNGGNNFGGTAFNGDRGLDRTMYPEKDVPTERPRITHAALMKLGQDWVDAMGGEFQGDRECGCVPSHYLLRLSAETDVETEAVYYKAAMKLTDIPIRYEPR